MTHNPFKAGDRVRCIRALGGGPNAVREGREYTVEKASRYYVNLAGGPDGGWDYNRFELVSEPLKVGDRVRVVEEYMGKKPDLIGTVCDVRKDAENVGVEFAESIGGHSCNGKCKDGFGWYFPADHLERVKEAPKVLAPKPVPAPSAKTYIISLRKPDGSFAPAGKPRTYPTRTRAETVAQDMATRHGGDFVVFEAVALASRPAVVTPPVTLTAL